MVDFHNTCYYHGLMKPDLRISVKDFRRDKNLKILVQRAVFSHRQFYVRMNGSPWPKDGRPVSLSPRIACLRPSKTFAKLSPCVCDAPTSVGRAAGCAV